jgi:hypothetical protein
MDEYTSFKKWGFKLKKKSSLHETENCYFSVVSKEWGNWRKWGNHSESYYLLRKQWFLTLLLAFLSCNSYSGLLARMEPPEKKNPHL